MVPRKVTRKNKAKKQRIHLKNESRNIHPKRKGIHPKNKHSLKGFQKEIQRKNIMGLFVFTTHRKNGLNPSGAHYNDSKEGTTEKETKNNTFGFRWNTPKIILQYNKA